MNFKQRQTFISIPQSSSPHTTEILYDYKPQIQIINKEKYQNGSTRSNCKHFRHHTSEFSIFYVCGSHTSIIYYFCNTILNITHNIPPPLLYRWMIPNIGTKCLPYLASWKDVVMVVKLSFPTFLMLHWVCIVMLGRWIRWVFIVYL